MSSIDRRIVEMSIDNDQFLSGSAASVRALKDLNKALDLKDASNSLSNLQKVGDRFSLANIGRGVEDIASRFSTLGIIGIGVLEEIGRKAVNIGLRISDAFTIQPIRTGLAEYETQINAVQTILANTESKGTTLEQVNKALDELNYYADKTIYNFTEMTRNIGTFTAAGVDLETSTKAIKGIANLAAASGSNSQQASRAMYQLSQAIASGVVKLQDWNSVVNAGMGGTLFQNSLLETARVHGVAVDEIIAKQGSFRESLKEGWLSVDILLETLNKFTGDMTEAELKSIGYTDEQIAGIIKLGETANNAATKVKTFTQLMDTLKEAAQSGWTQSWEILIGDFEEAKELLTSISDYFSDIINKSAEARNELLQGWKDLGGRSAVINSVKNTWNGLLGILKPIKEAFRDIFPAMTSKKLFDITKAVEKFTEKLKISDGAAANIKRTFKGVFAVFDIGWEALKAIARGFSELVSYISPASGSLLSFTGDIGDFIVKIRDAIKKSDTFNQAVGRIVDALKPVADLIKKVITRTADLAEAFKSLNMEWFVKLLDKVKDGLQFIGEKFQSIGRAIGKAGEALKNFIKRAFNLPTIIEKTLTGVRNLTENMSRGIKEAIQGGGLSKKLGDVLTIGALATMAGTIRKLFENIFKFVIDGSKDLLDNLQDVVDGVTDLLGGVKDTLRAFQMSINAKTLLKIAYAIAILTASFYILSKIPTERILPALVGLASLFGSLLLSFSGFAKVIEKTNMVKLSALGGVLVGISVAVLILSIALKKLSKIDWDGVIRGLFGVATLSFTMVKTLKGISGKDTKGLVKTAFGLMIFGVAINILARAVRKLGELDPIELTNGLIGVGVLCAELALFLKASDFDGLGVFKGIGLMAVAGALVILATAVKKLGELPTEDLIKGLSAVGGLLLEIAIFSKMTSNSKHVISSSIALTILAAGMLILEVALRKMGSLEWEEIAKGLIGLGGGLVIVSAAMNLLPSGMVTKSLGLIGVGVALNLFAKAMQDTAGMSWDEIARSLVVLGGSLAIISVSMLALNKSLTGAAALVIITKALEMFVPVMKSLGEIPLKELGQSLLILVGIFAVVGGAAFILRPLTPVILALSGAFFLFALGVSAIAASTTVFSTSMASMAAMSAVKSEAISLSFSAILSIIPTFIKKIGEGLIAFARVIKDGAGVIADAIIAIIKAILKVISESAPELMESIASTLLKMLQTLRKYLPDLLQVGIDLVLQLMEGIERNIGRMTDKAIDIMFAFLDGIAARLDDIIEQGYTIAMDLIYGLIDGVEKYLPDLMEEIGHLAGAIIDGLVTGIGKGVWRFGEALWDLGKKGLNKFKEVLGIASPSKEFAEAGVFSVLGLVKGINDTTPKATNATADLAKAAVNQIKKVNEPFKNAAKGNANALVTGYNDKIPNVASAAGNLANTAVKAISSKDESFKKAGSLSGEEYGKGLGEQLDKTLEDVKEKREEIEEVLKKPYDEAVLAGDVNNTNWKDYNAMDAANSWKNQPVTDSTTLKEIIRAMGGEYTDWNIRAWNTGGYEKLREAIEREKVAKEVIESMHGFVNDNTIRAWVEGGYEGLKKQIENEFRDIYEDTMDEGYQTSAKDLTSNIHGQDLLKEGTTLSNRIGEAISSGVSSGIQSAASTVTNAVKDVASSAVSTFTKFLGIHSPSRVFFEKARYINQGLAEGLAYYSPIVTDAMQELSDDMTYFNPVITPVVDVTDAKRGLGLIRSLMDDGYLFDAPVTKVKAEIVESRDTSRPSEKPGDTNISFTQNNYSPKALSRMDIYRQTKNQIRRMKEVIKAT